MRESASDPKRTLRASKENPRADGEQARGSPRLDLNAETMASCISNNPPQTVGPTLHCCGLLRICGPAVVGMLAELEARDIVYIKNIDTFEDKYVSPLGHILAWRAAPEFGAASDQALAALSQQAEEHLNEMERVAIRDYPPRTMRTDFPITRRTTI